MKFIINLFITAGVAILLSSILSGIHFEAFTSALFFAIVLSILNVTIKPILKIIGIPLNILTLGFFSLIINAIIILIADYFIQEMRVSSFLWAFIFSIGLSVITAIIREIFDIE